MTPERFDKPDISPKVLVIGAMNMDVQAVASRVAIPGDSTPGLITTSAGGVGRNIAEGLVRLGIATTLLTAAADDDAGRQLVAHCKQTGIETVIINPARGLNTPSYVSLYSEDGGLLYAINDMQMVEQLNVAGIPRLDPLIAAADMCVIDANLPNDLINSIAAKIEHQILVADGVSVAKCQRLQGVLSKLSVLKVNLLEAQTLARTEIDAAINDNQLEHLLEQLLLSGPEKILMTLGETGALLAWKTNGKLSIERCSAPEVTVKSVNGAGDALMAGFLAAYLYGQDTARQLRWGTQSATLSLGTDKACSEKLSLETMKQSTTEI